MTGPVDIEALIETYVRQRSRLDPGQIDRVERLLRDDPAARALRDFFVSFHQELEAVSAEIQPGVREFTDRLFRTGPITLVRLRSVRPTGPTVLAAQTAPPPVRARHRLLVALSGRPDEPVVRLLEDREEGVIRAFVLGLDRLPAVLKIPGLHETVPIDEHGRAVLSGARRSVAWDEVSAIIFPHDSFHSFTGSGQAVVSDTDVRLMIGPDETTLHFDGAASFAVYTDSGGLRVAELEGQPRTIHLTGRPAPVSIWMCP